MNLTTRLVVGALVLTTTSYAARTLNATVVSEAAQGEPFGCPLPRPTDLGGGALPLPPAYSPTVLTGVQLCFPTQRVTRAAFYLSMVGIDDFLLSRQLRGQWTSFDKSTERMLRRDYQKLVSTGLLADLSIEIVDEPYPFPNGVQGVWVVFRMEEYRGEGRRLRFRPR